MRRKLLWAVPVGLLASLAAPQLALADTIDGASGVLTDGAAINTLWVIVAGLPGDVHAGRVPVARDRVLARQERRDRGRRRS